MYVFSLFVAIAIKLSNLLSLALISFTFDITLLSIVNSFSSSNFPDKFIFEGSLMHVQQQIGNAVPPLLAKAVFEKILSYGRTV